MVFNEYGLLPVGIHKMKETEFVKFFGFNPKRQDMIKKGFKPFLAEILGYAVKTIYIDGSFVTAKENPGDIDAYIVTDTSSDLFVFISSNYDRWEMEYRVQVQIAYSDLEGECSVDWWQNHFSMTSNPAIRKGFVALEN